MNQKGFIPAIILVSILLISGLGAVGAFYLNKQSVKLKVSSKESTPSAGITSQLPRPQIPSPISQVSSFLIPKSTSIKIGNLKGRVVGGYFSTPLADTAIFAKGEGVEKKVTTDNSGNFLLTNLPIGQYNLSFSHQDYNIADKSIKISEGDNTLLSSQNGFLKVFKPTTVKGVVFVDTNDNRYKDSGETGLNALIEVYNKVGDSNWNLYKNISIDNSGSFTIEIKDGSTYKLVPTDYTYYRKPAESNQFIVDGYGGTKEFSFAYYPTSSQAKFSIEVFNDKNENGVKDSGEENIDYYYAEVTNISTGNNYKTWVSTQQDQGKEGGSMPMDYGAYKIRLVPGDDSWAYYYKITKVEDIVTITNTSGDQTARLGVHKLDL